MDSSIQLRYVRIEDGSITERLPPPTITITTASGSQVMSPIDVSTPAQEGVITITTASGSQVMSPIDVSTPAQEGVITTTDGVRRCNCTFRSKQDKKRLKRFRRLQKERGHR